MASVIRKDHAVPAPHPLEFRRRAVELAREGSTPIAEVAKGLGISESCLRTWLAQADVDDHGSPTRLRSVEKKELVELRMDQRRLKLEVKILKRAAAYVVRENLVRGGLGHMRYCCSRAV
ncbi:MAG: transposase [Pseudonocardiales bacterium]|nr:transposase [Pseudonocardiales bacterium]